MITIFTPTYNRAYILPKLYDSLKKQTCKNFEWLIVDDGSSDNTKELVDKWILENEIKINYLKIENGGKSNAINIGVQNAKGDLFFIVDSDDFITENAVFLIENTEKSLNKNQTFFIAGHCYKRSNYRTNSAITSFNGLIPEFADSLELAFKYGASSDKAEIFYTDVLKKFPFPKIENNKFIPEALIWYRIAKAGYKFKICDEVIYMCDYIEDGYTQNFKSNLKKNCKGFKIFYKECLSYSEIPLKIRIKYFIRFLQCKLYEVFQ